MIIIAYLALVLASALAGALALVVACVRGEDRRGHLPGEAPTLAARAVRGLCGLRVSETGQACLAPQPARRSA